jgi:HEAT repeat protein
VRYRALEILAEKKPEVVVKRAVELLQVPNDPFRYLVCQVLAKKADPQAADALEALVREPKDSLNPNVLRIRAVQALAACGDADSVAAIAPHATSGVYFNGLTGVAIDALAAIAKRLPAVRKKVAATLRTGYPMPPEDGDARKLRACTALAKRIHAALADPRPFPATYDATARAALMEAPK